MNTGPFANYDDALPIPADGIASRPLLDMKDGSKVVLFALAQGQEISPHQSPFPAHVLVLAGRMRVQVGTQTHDVRAHEEVALPMGHPHGLLAVTPAHFLLIMKRAVKDQTALRSHQVPAPGAASQAVPCACTE